MATLPRASLDVRRGFERVRGLRALLCALGDFAGVRAEGTVTATATGADAVLPRWTYGVPIIDGKFVYARMVKTLHHTIVTSGGTPVAVRSVCGGASGNLPANTVIVWQPPAVGVASRGVVASGITGGIEATPGAGRCRRVVGFDQMSRADADAVQNGALSQVPGEGLPAIVIAGDGSNVERLMSQGRAALREHRYTAHIFSVHYAQNDERAIEARCLTDAVEQRLQGLASLDGEGGIDGEVFSGAPLETGRESRGAAKPGILWWMLELSIFSALPAEDLRETDGVSWQPWSTTRITEGVVADDPLEQRTIVDVTAEET